MSENPESKKRTRMEKLRDFFYPKNIGVEMTRYQINRTSYSAGLFAILLFVAAFAICYSGSSICGGPSFTLLGWTNIGAWTFIDVILNILILLFQFTATLEMENYSVVFGGISCGLGIFNIVRIFFYPLALLNAGPTVMGSGIYATLSVCYILSGVFSIFSGILSITRGKALRKYLATVPLDEDEKVEN